ncbi:hypothetical protein GCM10027347_52610 [Larkinella harenae]
MPANQTLFDDLADVKGILRGIDQLSQANEKYGKSAEAVNDRISQANKKVIESLKEQKETILQLNVAQKARQKQLQDEANEVYKLEKAHKQQQELLQRNNALFDANGASVDALKTRVKDLRREYDSLSNAEAKDAARKKAIEAETKALNTVLREQVNATKLATQAVNGAVGSYDRLSQQLNQMKAQLRAMPNAFNETTGAINKNNKAAVELQKQIEVSDRALKNMDATMGNHQRNVGNYSSVLGNLKGQLIGVGTGLLSIQALFNGLKSAFDLTVRMERMDAGIRAITRDNEDFIQTQQFLINLSKQLGQDYEIVTKTYKGLGAATRDTSLEGQRAQQIFAGIIRAGAALQLSNEEVEGSLYAISQMVSKGKVSMEELRQQLGERLPGAMKLLSNALGISEAQLNKLVENGDLYARDVLPKLAKELDKTYGKDAQRNIETFGGQWNNLNTEVALLLKILNEDKGVTGPFTSLLKTLSDRLEKVRVVLQSKDWGLIFKFATDLTGYTAPQVDAMVQRSRANIADEEAYKRMSPEARTNRRSEFITRSGAIQAQINTLRDRAPRDVNEKAEIQNRLKQLEKELDFYERKIQRMQTIHMLALKEDAVLQERLKKEDDDRKAMEWEEGKKKRDAAAKRAENEADRRLRERLSTIRTNASSDVNGFRGSNERGEMTDADFITAQYKARTDAALEQIRILNQANKQGAANWKSEYAAAQKEITDAAADWYEGRNKLENDAWNKALEVAKKALNDVGDTESRALKKRADELEVDYSNRERLIREDYNKQLITEKQRNERIHAIREEYLTKLSSVVTDAYDEQEITIINRYDEEIAQLKKLLESSTLTYKQISDAKVKIAELEQAKMKKLAESGAKRDSSQSDVSTKKADNILPNADRAKYDTDSEQFKTTKEQLQWQLAGEAAQGYFDLVNEFRQRDLDRVEKNREAEKKRLEESVSYEKMSQEAKRNAMAAIDRKYDAEAAQIKRKQAIAEKAAAVFSIGIDLAVGIIRNNKNFTPIAAAPLNALLIALAAIQTAAVIAKPIPQFKDGKNLESLDRYEGPALVGEAGRELWFGKNGVEMVDRPSIVNVGKNDVILPNPVTERLLSNNGAFEGRAILDQVIRNQVSYNNIVQANKRNSSYRGPSARDIANALADELEKRPWLQLNIDENGFTRKIIKDTTATIERNNRRHFGRR